jgi:hypothetical protein
MPTPQRGIRSSSQTSGIGLSPVYNVVGVVKNFFMRLETNLQCYELDRGQGRPRKARRLSKTLDAA